MQQGIKEKDIRDFVKYAERLNTIMKRIREYKPDAMLFAQEDNLTLVSSTIRNKYGSVDCDKAIQSVCIDGMDSGAY